MLQSLPHRWSCVWSLSFDRASYSFPVYRPRDDSVLHRGFISGSCVPGDYPIPFRFDLRLEELTRAKDDYLLKGPGPVSTLFSRVTTHRDYPSDEYTETLVMLDLIGVGQDQDRRHLTV